MIRKSYWPGSQPAKPDIFTETRDFEFTSADGLLKHRLLLPGPRGFRIVAVSTTGHRASFVEESRITVTMPRCGSAHVTTSGETFETQPGQIVALGPSERHCALRPDPTTGLYESYTILAPPDWHVKLDDECVHRQPTEMGDRLVALLDFAYAFLEGEVPTKGRIRMLSEALVEDTLLAALVDPDEDSETDYPDHFESILTTARDYIMENLAEPISASDIATAAGVNVRTLQRAFRKAMGTTARAYMTGLRLDMMRRTLELAPPGTTVSTATLDAGLFHLGRASAAYLQRFGELPSETLRRAGQKL